VRPELQIKWDEWQTPVEIKQNDLAKYSNGTIQRQINQAFLTKNVIKVYFC